ncbi:MAG: AAA-like domain-containing protein [Cyanobacteriota bacterium]
MSGPAFRYQVGGSLPPEFLGYVERGADQELVDHLLRGETCSVFNSRQMGKSSLKVRAMQRLRAAGRLCAVIDPQGRGTSVTEEQWYAGTVKRLIEDFDLEERLPYRRWSAQADQALSPVERFFEFIDRDLLPATGDTPLVIFVEEVDSLLSLQFGADGFFTLIRSLHERRAAQPMYRRLCFAFLGVATPYDLIRGESRRAYNIDHAVELGGFSVAEARPLLAGLEGRVAEPEAALAAVVQWSGGQPFLTQKLLALLLEEPQGEASTEAWVAEVVRRRVLTDWEANDNPPHLRTIRDRLLLSEERGRGRLLGLAQALLDQGRLPMEPIDDHQLLRLTGMVSLRQGQLVLANPIVAALFDQAWLERQLADLRPPIYREALRAWQAAEPEQRDQHLIAGAPLREARTWARDRRLADADQKFLAASREADEAAQRAEQTARFAKLTGVLSFTLVGFLSLIVINMSLQQSIKEFERRSIDAEDRTKALSTPMRLTEEEGFEFKPFSHALTPLMEERLDIRLPQILNSLSRYKSDTIEIIVMAYADSYQHSESSPTTSHSLSMSRARSIAYALERRLRYKLPFLTYRALATEPPIEPGEIKRSTEQNQMSFRLDGIDIRYLTTKRLRSNEWAGCRTHLLEPSKRPKGNLTTSQVESLRKQIRIKNLQAAPPADHNRPGDSRDVPEIRSRPTLEPTSAPYREEPLW